MSDHATGSRPSTSGIRIATLKERTLVASKLKLNSSCPHGVLESVATSLDSARTRLRQSEFDIKSQQPTQFFRSAIILRSYQHARPNNHSCLSCIVKLIRACALAYR